MSQDKKRPLSASYRWQIAYRVIAAVVGGYAVTSLAISVLALLLTKSEIASPAVAVLSTTLGGFILYAAIVIWVFSVERVGRIGLWLGGWAAAMSIVLLTLTTSN